MANSFPWLKAAIIFLTSVLPSVVFANIVGQAVGVSQNAFLERNGARGYLEQGGEVRLGDVITTGATGQVQLLFQDGTKMAVSANSSLVIERILFDSSGSASEFTVNAVGGAFRFLSGKSEPSAYKIQTPNATMGIRGTEFDFAASRQSGVRVATFNGEVELCNRAGQCVSIPGGCSVAGVDGSGRFVVPQNETEEAALLQTGFPYVRNQNRLRRDYRADVEDCADTAVFQEGGLPPAPPETPRPNNPNTGGSQAGGDAGAGFGGSTAGGVDAGQGGPSGPGDADASDGGASAGGAGGASAGDGGVSAGDR